MTTKAVSTLKDALSKKELKGVTRGEKIHAWSSSKITGVEIYQHPVRGMYLYYRCNRRLKYGNNAMEGDVSRLYGDCTYLLGDVSGLTGDCSRVHGHGTGVFGDLEGLNRNERPRTMYRWLLPWDTTCIDTNTSIVEVDVD
jgi:hypothetical protein